MEQSLQSSDTSKGGRLTYIDVLETIAIFCIAMCHQVETMGDSVVSTFILQFVTVAAVPIFFMANGTLLLNRPLDLKRHYKKTAMLFVSATVWKLLYFVFFFALDKFPFGELHGSEVLGYFFGGGIENPYVPAEHFWYLYAMVCIYFIYPLIYTVYHSAYKKAYYVILGVCFVFFLLIRDYMAIAATLPGDWWIAKVPLDVLATSIEPFSVRAGTYLFYFMLGPVLHGYFYQNEKTGNKRILLGLIALVGFGILILDRLVAGYALADSWVRLPDDYRRVGLVLMSGGIYALVASISSFGTRAAKFFEFFSVRTMGIFAIHNAVAVLLSSINRKYFGIYNIGFHLLKTLLVLGICIAAAELLSLIPGVRKALGLTWRK